MKTTLIHIDPHDDLTSIKDKMTWSKSQRLLLFFPSGYPIVQANLAMKLILRHAAAQGAKLAIITRDRNLRSIAEDVGISCFTSAPLAEKSAWKTDRAQVAIRLPKGKDAILKQNETIPVNRQYGISSTFQKVFTLVLLLALILLVIIFFLPSAQIVIFPVSEFQDITYEVTAGVDILAVDYSGRIPARVLTREISDMLTKASTGSITLPMASASGLVEIVNISDQDVFIPAGSRLKRNTATEIIFELLNDVNLSSINKEPVTANIKAVEPGSGGNVPAGDTFLLSGYENLIQIQNPTVITGGNDQTLPSPADADYYELYENLTENLHAQCEDLVENLVQTGQVLIPESVRLGEVTNEDEFPSIGEPADNASLSISVECSGLVIQKADELQLALRILDQNLPDGMKPLNEKVAIDPLGKAETDDGEQFSWRVKVSREISPIWNSEELVTLLLGKPVEEAKEILSNVVSQTKAASITIKPVWWKHLPMLPNRLQIGVNGE